MISELLLGFDVSVVSLFKFSRRLLCFCTWRMSDAADDTSIYQYAVVP